MTVTWEEPDNVQRGPRQHMYAYEAEQLRANPGRWAVIRKFTKDKRPSAYTMVSLLKRGRLSAFQGEENWEAVTRTTGDTVKVYARYIGPVVTHTHN